MTYKITPCAILLFLSNLLVKSQVPKLYAKDLIRIGDKGISENITYRVTKRGDTILNSIEKWDIKGRLTYFVFHDRDGFTDEFYNIYNENGKLLQVKSNYTSQDNNYSNILTFFYNGQYLNRVVGITNKNDTIITNYNLTADSNKIMVESTISYPLTNIEFEFNKDGTVRSQINNLGLKTKFEYDSIGNLIKQIEGSDHIFGYVFNDSNLLIEKNELVDGISYKVVTYEYDSLKRVSNLLEKGYKDKVFKIIDYTYNHNGERTSFIFYKRKKRKPDEIYFEKLTKW